MERWPIGSLFIFDWLFLTSHFYYYDLTYVRFVLVSQLKNKGPIIDRTKKGEDIYTYGIFVTNNEIVCIFFLLFLYIFYLQVFKYRNKIDNCSNCIRFVSKCRESSFPHYRTVPYGTVLYDKKIVRGCDWRKKVIISIPSDTVVAVY